MSNLRKGDVTSYLISKYPLSNQELWDKAGFSFKHNLRNYISGVILAVDITYNVVQKAIENNCNLIITHHPFLFEKSRSLEFELAPYKKEIIKLINKHKITCLSMHTNYDADRFGTSYQLVKKMNFQHKIVENEQKYVAIFENDFLTNKLINQLKNALNVNNLRTNFKDHFTPKTVAILSGHGDLKQIMYLHRQGIELIISGDFKWSDWLYFEQSNVKVIEIPHLTEQIMAIDFANQLHQRFSNLRVFIVEQPEVYFNC